jgi:hypothetical protein
MLLRSTNNLLLLHANWQHNQIPLPKDLQLMPHLAHQTVEPTIQFRHGEASPQAVYRRA